MSPKSFSGERAGRLFRWGGQYSAGVGGSESGIPYLAVTAISPTMPAHDLADVRRLVMSQDAGYTTSSVEHYLLPLIYPALWFTGGFPAWGFPVIGCGVLLFNGVVYTHIGRRGNWVGAFSLAKKRGGF